MSEIIEIVDQDIKIVIINMHCMFKKVKENMKIIKRNGRKKT
jgi:hypothetical protein